MNKKNYCYLCNSVGKKMAKAHILPRKFYDDLIKPDDRPLLLVPPKGEGHQKRSQIGVYDTQLLCVDCERSNSDIDDYAQRVFFQEDRVPEFFDRGKPLAERINNVDSDRLKLFFIFLIWRMGQTSDDMFKAVRLGPYLEICRQAVRNRDCSQLLAVDVIVSRFVDDKHGGFLGPTKLKDMSFNGYRVHFARHVCFVKVDQRRFGEPFDDLSLSSRDHLYVLLREFRDSPEKEAMVRHVKSKRRERR